MILVIDNYDSFTYNLVQLLWSEGAQVEVYRNDRIDVEAAMARRPERILISPGPGRPEDAGITVALIQAAAAAPVPVLGVCLGHQAIAHAFGGRVVRATRLMHGKTSMIRHDGRGVYAGLPNPFEATRYHSLVADASSLPPCLEATAWANDGALMGLRHKTLPIEGVQFHPESILSREGPRLVVNFLQGLGDRRADQRQA